MRGVLAAIAIVGCSEPTYVPKPLPPLVAPAPAADVQPIVVHELGLAPGERMVWEVRLRGMAIGRLELVVGKGEVRSRFATNTLASTFASVEHELVTTLDRDRPHSTRERLDANGTLRQFSTEFAGTTSHSLHTALGAVRAWAVRARAPGFLHVVFADKLVRLELAQPAVSRGWTRIGGKLVGLASPVSFRMWLDAARTITRIEVRSDGEQITATPSF